MSNNVQALAKRVVNSMSVVDGCRFRDGWLWAIIILDAMQPNAHPRISFISNKLAV